MICANERCTHLKTAFVTPGKHLLLFLVQRIISQFFDLRALTPMDRPEIVVGLLNGLSKKLFYGECLDLETIKEQLGLEIPDEGNVCFDVIFSVLQALS